MSEEIARAVREARKPLRLEKAAWQRAAIGLLVVSAAANTAFFGLYHGAQARWREEASRLRSELHQVEETKDRAVRELGAMALSIAQEKKAREDQAAAYEAAGAYRYVGECTVTYYCCESCEHICGTGDGITASGLPLTPGIVAVDPEVIALGSTVVVDGQKYLAADTGALVKGLHIDIAVPTHEQAQELGVRTESVWVVAHE